MKIEEYGIENYIHSGPFDIGDPYQVLRNIAKKAPRLAEKLEEESMRIQIDERNYANVEGVRIHENGIVIYVNNTIPCDANRYDDFSRARMYIFNNGEIHYVFDEVDTRIEQNKEGTDVNRKILVRLDSQLGMKQELDPTIFLSSVAKAAGQLSETSTKRK